MDEKEVLLGEFRRVQEQVGWVSAGKYDRLNIPHPNRRKLERLFNMPWTQLVSMALQATPDEDPTYQALIAKNRSLQQQVSQARDLNRAIVDTCLVELKKLTITPPKIPKKQRSKQNLEFHLMRSDDHCGDYVDEQWTQGLGSYSAEAYVKRMAKLGEKVVMFREQDKASLGLNKLVMFYLGDHVTGEALYQGQAFQLDLYLSEQMIFAYKHNMEFILRMAAEFPEVEIFCVPGNHGRPGKKGQHHPKSNFDYLLYFMLAQSVQDKGIKNVKIYISESPMMLVALGKFNAVLNHGDNVNRYMQIPYYGLERQFRLLPALYGMPVHYELVGHHHTPSNLADSILMNGSLKGGDDLSINKMTVASKPSQKAWYFHGEKGMNRESNLQVAAPTVLVQSEDGIYTPYRKAMA